MKEDNDLPNNFLKQEEDDLAGIFNERKLCLDLSVSISNLEIIELKVD